MIKFAYAMAFAACVGIALLSPAAQKPTADHYSWGINQWQRI